MRVFDLFSGKEIDVFGGSSRNWDELITEKE
jgi:hypothetical protein